MAFRRVGACVWVVCVGWGTLGAAEPVKTPTAAQQLWQQGQDAIRDGRTDEAVRLYHESLRLDPGLACNYLGLATAFLDKADDEGAAPYLAQYLAMQPRCHLVRAQYAELLLRLGDVAAGLRELERFAADIQDDPDLARKHLIHCHTQLMEIAELAEDDYGAHLHHGIALYLLACQRAPLPDDDPNLAPESLLCKAAGELMQARQERPDEARPCWYLFAVWSRLAQNQPASRWLRAAEDAAPFTSLTPAERRDLHLACNGRAGESRRK